MKISLLWGTAVRRRALLALHVVMAITAASLSPGVSVAQVHRPITWTFESLEGTAGNATLKFSAHLKPGWHLYSQFMEKDGPLPTTFSFEDGDGYQRIGNVTEVNPAVKVFDETFQMEVAWFEESAAFLQQVSLTTPEAMIKGKIEFMVCTDEMCLPPDQVSFAISTRTTLPAKRVPSVARPDSLRPDDGRNTDGDVRGSEDDVSPAVGTTAHDTSNRVTTMRKVKEAPVTNGNANQYIQVNAAKPSEPNLWNIFLLGIAGGLMAVLMPCIFPMLPFTIGYFAKQSGTKGKAVARSVFYGVSIVVVYVGLGLLVTAIFGSAALNALSTNGIFNLFFFLLLTVFAASFLGAFEISLPASWVTMADKRSDRRGLAGIFFMAVTLSLVSFSCTGPIIGTLLVEAAVTGEFMGPATGMFGFSLALAAPFTFFSMFPAWLTTLPRSGAWLNSVKVVLGFLEAALALKFLSNVDLAYHWEWLDREVFLALWIVIFGLMGLYLLGKLTLSNDDHPVRISVPRLLLAIVTLAFTVYMVPGLWGAPLKAISAFLPPQQTQDFDLYAARMSSPGQGVFPAEAMRQGRKYSELFHAPHGLDAFFDYEEGLAYARKVNKPVIIDFTGHACVNCRKMETVVWSEAQVLNTLRRDYVLVQLYVDDKTALGPDEKFISPYSGRKLSTLGSKWSDFQAGKFGTNAQPYYVLADGEGAVLTPPRGADYKVESFAEFLEAGLQKFREQSRM